MNFTEKFVTQTNFPQVKICGLTDPNEAADCASLGADAIGCVFYPKSPRNVSLDQAKKIVLALPSHVRAVGVFVNASYDEIMHAVAYCGLHVAQLHGQEPHQLSKNLQKQNIPVIKALFMTRDPLVNKATNYKASAYLIECGKGRLPGGNAMVWNWEDALEFGKNHPLILAGGLAPENITDAITAAIPDAVDVSSGVEASPGRKDLDRVSLLLNTIKSSKTNKKLKKIF